MKYTIRPLVWTSYRGGKQTAKGVYRKYTAYRTPENKGVLCIIYHGGSGDLLTNKSYPSFIAAREAAEEDHRKYLLRFLAGSR